MVNFNNLPHDLLVQIFSNSGNLGDTALINRESRLATQAVVNHLLVDFRASDKIRPFIPDAYACWEREPLANGTVLSVSNFAKSVGLIPESRAISVENIEKIIDQSFERADTNLIAFYSSLAVGQNPGVRAQLPQLPQGTPKEQAAAIRTFIQQNSAVLSQIITHIELENSNMTAFPPD